MFNNKECYYLKTYCKVIGYTKDIMKSSVSK